METQQTRTEMPATMPVGEHLFDEVLEQTGIADFGISFEDLQSGRVPLPPQGARFDITYEGAIEGEKLKGYLKGVDYLYVRSDGRMELNIYATVTTNDGEKINVSSGGILKTPDPATGIAPVRLNMEFLTVSPAYTWVNTLQAWGTGTVNMRTRDISVQVYAA